MCNMATIPDDILTDAEEGDEVSVKVTGTIVEEDGQRKIEITHVNGEPVETMEECSSCEGKPHHGGEMPDADDALKIFMIKLNKPKK